MTGTLPGHPDTVLSVFLNSYFGTLFRMTRRVTISVPDDVADQLDAIPPRQVSAYVTEALRRRRSSDDMRSALVAAGHPEYPHDPQGAVRRVEAGRVGAEVREAAVARFAESVGRPVGEVRAELDRHADQ
jgi:hypothetical protein